MYIPLFVIKCEFKSKNTHWNRAHIEIYTSQKFTNSAVFFNLIKISHLCFLAVIRSYFIFLNKIGFYNTTQPRTRTTKTPTTVGGLVKLWLYRRQPYFLLKMRLSQFLWDFFAATQSHLNERIFLVWFRLNLIFIEAIKNLSQLFSITKKSMAHLKCQFN